MGETDEERTMRYCYGISRRIDELMMVRKMTFEQFARKMNLTGAELNEWLTGKHVYTMPEIMAATRVLKHRIIDIANS